MTFSRSLNRVRFWCNYIQQRTDFAITLAYQKYDAGEILHEEVWHHCLKNAIVGKMTYLYQNKCFEMEPTVYAKETLFVRKLPYLNANCMQSKLEFLPTMRRFEEQICVGDVVVLKDPLHSNKHVVRRLAALSGSEMASNKEDEPFVLADGECWVLSDNKKLGPGESNDSRTYGPIPVTDIVGRVICRLALNRVSFVQNSKVSMQRDLSIVYVEVDEKEWQRHIDGRK